MKVVISGYYGFNNGGDEALLSGMLTALREAGGVEATVLSNDPKRTEKLHGVRSLHRESYPALWSHLKNDADLFISGGGGLLQDRTSRRSALYYLGLMNMAFRAGVPTYLYANGVGPIQSAIVKVAARRTLHKVAGAGARDPESARILRELGMDEASVHVTADAAFALPPYEAAKRRGVLDSCGIPWGEQPLIGVIWRNPAVGRSFSDQNAGEPLWRQVAAGVAQLARKIDGRVVVLSLYPEADAHEGDALAAALVEAGCSRVHRPGGATDFRSLRGLIESMDINVSVRYHGVLFSALGRVPAVAIEYDPKVRYLAHQLDLPSMDPAVKGPELYDALHHLWNDREAARSRLDTHVEALRQRAMAEGVQAYLWARQRRGASS